MDSGSLKGENILSYELALHTHFRCMCYTHKLSFQTVLYEARKLLCEKWYITDISVQNILFNENNLIAK